MRGHFKICARNEINNTARLSTLQSLRMAKFERPLLELIDEGGTAASQDDAPAALVRDSDLSSALDRPHFRSGKVLLAGPSLKLAS